MKYIVKLFFFMCLLAMEIQNISAEPKLTDMQAKESMADWTEFNGPLSRISARVSEVQVFLGTQDKEVNEYLKSINESQKFLTDKWISSATEPAPKLYLDSLIGDSNLLKSIVDKKLNKQSAIGLLKDVSDDLKIKAAHCKLSAIGWASTIDVFVTTKKDNKEINSLYVSYAPKGWASSDEHWYNLPIASSPASGPLVPGNYMMKVNNQKPKAYVIGGNGEKTLPIELIVY